MVSKHARHCGLMARTKRIFCLKKCLEDYPSPWKFFLDERLLSVGGKFVILILLSYPWYCRLSMSFTNNDVLLLGKYDIYSRKCQNAKPSLKGFIAKTKRVYSIEPHNARKRDKLTYHLKRWEKLISEVTNWSISNYI